MTPAKSLDAQIGIRISQGANGPNVSASSSDRDKTMPLSALLPGLRSLTNSFVDAAVAREERAGRKISCKAKCGACCRQLVPLSVTEARQLPELLADLDEAHRGRVLERFEEALTQLRDSGLLERLVKLARLSPAERTRLSLDYFRQAISCPFLEDESCTVYRLRPLVCRQYLVTSAPSHCASPSSEKVVPVGLGANVLAALHRLEAKGSTPPRIIPLILAPFLDLGSEGPGKTAPEWLRGLLQAMQVIREEQIAQQP